MSKQRGTLAEQFVQNRRKIEANENNLNSYLRVDKVSRHIAGWEDKCEDQKKNRFIQARMTELRRQAEQQLATRQAKLKALYDREHEECQTELRNMRMTKEQIKENMIERVDDLKKKREATRMVEVEQKLERRFREGADELRKVESKVRENMTRIDREKQISEKHNLMERKFEEEMFYAELWRRDKNNKDRAEAQVAEEKRRRNDARNDIQATQYRELQDEKAAEANRVKMEQEMLKEQWRIEKENNENFEKEQARLNRKMNNEIREQNMHYRNIKQQAEQAEKQADSKRVQEIIEKERILDQQDQEKRDKYKADTRAFLANFQNRADDAKVNQDHLDMLLQQENEKQLRKQQEKWEREENARIELMKDVYKNREEALWHKKAISDAENEVKEQEKRDVRLRVSEYAEEEKRKELEEIMRNKQHQNEVLWQINEKNEQKRRAILDEMEEERKKRLVELNYDRRIKEEEQIGRQRIAEAKYGRYY